MYDVKDLTARYGVTVNTVLGWIRRNELQAVNVGRMPGKKRPRWRITEAAIAEFERRRSTGAIAQSA
jgi:hypothetical protein